MALSVLPVDAAFSSGAVTSSTRLLRVAFINKMPDAAFESTERQFLGLLEEASPADLDIEVRCFTMAGVEREGAAAQRIADDYLLSARLREDRPDVVIVTGSNPVQVDVEDEPYWSEMVDLLEWTRDHVPAMLLSCLAAHAALDVFDGTRREHLSHKFTGLFPQVISSDHPLVAGLAQPLVLPHSRTNTVADERLRDAGYEIVMSCEPAGWSVATRRHGASDVVLVQGHPEYEPASLLFEYRRDARRYANGERDEPPPLPLHCVAGSDWSDLESMHHRLVEHRDPDVLATIDFVAMAGRAQRPWHDAAVRLYANWLNIIDLRSD